jgi:hypothetical protein
LLPDFGLGLGFDVVGVWVWVCVVWVCVVCVCVWVCCVVDDADELELELDEDDEDEFEDAAFFAFFFGSLLSVGSAEAEPALAVTEAAATSTLFGDASLTAAGVEGLSLSLPDALLTPKATTNAARAAATAIPICRGCMGSP